MASNSSLPLRHISLRVPWHTEKWEGTVCKNPSGNAECLILPNIREKRNDEKEGRPGVVGEKICDLHPGDWPPCVNERGTFMSPFEFDRDIRHPYSLTSELFKHNKPTTLRHPEFSASAIPFRWLNRKSAWDIAKLYDLDVDPDREPDDEDWLKNNNWVLNEQNQKSLLQSFNSAISEESSLCFFYANRTPMIDSEKRVLIGVGRVKHIQRQPRKYNNTQPNSYQSYMWEVMFQHSIQPEFKDGFLLPYHEILEKSKEDPSIDPAQYVAFAPEDRRIEFSYASEHVSHDAAIRSLLACQASIEKARKIIEGPWARVLKWIDDRLGEVQQLRGPYPGLGAVLTAFGVRHGNLLAYKIAQELKDKDDPWEKIENIFANPLILPPEHAEQITKTLQMKWQHILQKYPEKLALLKLLARFEITNEQAERFIVEEVRKENRIELSDKQILENPFAIYEADRMALDPISFFTVDRGIFPARHITEQFPLSAPSNIDDPLDSRRVKALTLYMLEEAIGEGHTLLPRKEIVLRIRNMELSPECPVDGTLFEAIEEEFLPEVKVCSTSNEESAYQLDRLYDAGTLISSTVQGRIKGKRNQVDAEWRKLVEDKFKEPDKDEQKARDEKAAALKELAESRFSVLIGSAGTGKTSMLSILCNHPAIRNNGLLLLAPTGKARVKLQQATGVEAQTIAQFLLPLDRYDEETGRYHTSNSDKFEGRKTLIIDEASMLTEEMLGAVLDGIRGVDHLILVGDPKQLPPIGAGRPFLDIVTYLAPQDIESRFPKVGKGYAELTVNRRQIGVIREDLQLAEWFSGRPLGPADDEIFTKIFSGKEMLHLRFESWKDETELQKKLLTLLTQELELESEDDEVSFEVRLGGNRWNDTDKVYFNIGAAVRVEDWQILTPVRNQPFGIYDLNRFIQKNFRKRVLQWAVDSNRPPFYFPKEKITKARGPEEIVYGDKVMNVYNKRRYNVHPEDNALNYVANGEIGIVVGQKTNSNSNWNGLPQWTNVEFSSQPGFSYGYRKGDFKDEGSPILELAYAITIHKSQGSDFGKVFLVIPQNSRLISRELLYTALTRQREKVIILHQGDKTDLRQFASDGHSDSAKRYTNLFSAPRMVAVKGTFLEDNLIHRSEKGEPMRSKSEVIIANALYSERIDYEYEQELIGSDGQIRYPDFTIEDENSGIIYYWEHLGMLETPQYEERWKRKLQWYRNQQILPYDEGGGENGTLIITRDVEGGIDSQKIKVMIKRIAGK